jgi:hypothetical protein
MMKATWSGFVIAMTLTACAGTQVAPDATTAPVVKMQDKLLELGEITMFEGDDARMKIHADGTTEIGYRSGSSGKIEPGKPFSSDSLPVVFKPGPSITADGAFTRDGKALAKLDPGGTFTVVATKEPIRGVTVTADKIVITAPQGSVSFEYKPDGTLQQIGGNKLNDKHLRIEGADTPGKRRAMLAFLSIMLAPHTKSTAGPTVESAPAATP